VTTYWGRTDPSASDQIRAARAADPARPEATAHLIDLTCLQETTNSAQAEAQHFRALAPAYVSTFGALPTAILATTPHVVGLARIFQIATGLQRPAVPVRVVDSVHAAAAFLSMDLAAAMTWVAEVHGHAVGGRCHAS